MILELAYIFIGFSLGVCVMMYIHIKAMSEREGTESE